jgi:hypothetical protein
LNLDFAEVKGIARFEPGGLPDSALNPVPVLLAGKRATETAAIAIVGRAGVHPQYE